MKALAIAMLVACGTPPANRAEPEPANVVTKPPAPPPPPSPAKRCLPVVAKECGCVYSCGIGEWRDGRWMVRHSFWNATELKARIEKWCARDQCTDAFAAEIVCDGICVPEPAEANCHFAAGGKCVSSEAS